MKTLFDKNSIGKLKEQVNPADDERNFGQGREYVCKTI